MKTRRPPQFAQRASTTIGAFVSGSLYYRKRPKAIPEIPFYSKPRDRRAWVMGWNYAAEKAGDEARLEVPVVRALTARKRSPAGMLEAAVIKEAAQVAHRRKWGIHRRNTGAVYTPEGRLIRYGEKGAADLYLEIPLSKTFTLHIEAEAKRRDGKGRQSKVQIDFQKRCEAQGIPYFVFTSGEEFEEKVDAILLDKSDKI